MPQLKKFKTFLNLQIYLLFSLESGIDAPPPATNFFFFENTHQDILIATPSTHLHVLIFDQKWEMNLIKIQASQDWYLSVYKITTTNGLLKNIEQIKNNQTVLVSLLNLLHFVTTIKTLHQFCCLVC